MAAVPDLAAGFFLLLPPSSRAVDVPPAAVDALPSPCRDGEGPPAAGRRSSRRKLGRGESSAGRPGEGRPDTDVLGRGVSRHATRFPRWLGGAMVLSGGVCWWWSMSASVGGPQQLHDDNVRYGGCDGGCRIW
uniref:Uncharacterized protein n=1 Tax=Oryza nivara TaxID=4536 RepID=A0A0E0IQX0_ORYNI